jgi:hypothetical protein
MEILLLYKNINKTEFYNSWVMQAENYQRLLTQGKSLWKIAERLSAQKSSMATKNMTLVILCALPVAVRVAFCAVMSGTARSIAVSVSQVVAGNYITPASAP